LRQTKLKKLTEKFSQTYWFVSEFLVLGVLCIPKSTHTAKAVFFEFTPGHQQNLPYQGGFDAKMATQTDTVFPVNWQGHFNLKFAICDL
jgi:hypothetical protein